MEAVYIKEFPGTPFSIEVVTKQNEPGTWNSTSVLVCREVDGVLRSLGEYIRNYPDFGRETFMPFRARDGNWYALYSANYSATRVMRLHDDSIEDWCGEEPSATGFCPVEFYIPKYHSYKDKIETGTKSLDLEYVVFDNECESDEEFLKDDGPNRVSTDYCNFGFLSGCVWGDDSSWKLRYADLSEVPDRKLTISDKFGYWELPGNLKLKQCVNMSNWEPGFPWIKLSRAESVNINTGERC